MQTLHTEYTATLASYSKPIADAKTHECHPEGEEKYLTSNPQGPSLSSQEGWALPCRTAAMAAQPALDRESRKACPRQGEGRPASRLVSLATCW